MWLLEAEQANDLLAPADCTVFFDHLEHSHQLSMTHAGLPERLKLPAVATLMLGSANCLSLHLDPP